MHFQGKLSLQPVPHADSNQSEVKDTGSDHLFQHAESKQSWQETESELAESTNQRGDKSEVKETESNKLFHYAESKQSWQEAKSEQLLQEVEFKQLRFRMQQLKCRYRREVLRLQEAESEQLLQEAESKALRFRIQHLKCRYRREVLRLQKNVTTATDSSFVQHWRD
jgi:hypothetical protein